MSRYIHTVCEDIVSCHETRNYSYLPGLVEEIRVLASRQEAAEDAQREYQYLEKECDQSRAKLTALKGDLSQLQARYDLLRRDFKQVQGEYNKFLHKARAESKGEITHPRHDNCCGGQTCTPPAPTAEP